MYASLLSLHNVLRWLVLLAGLWAFVRAWRGWMSRAQWTEGESQAGRWFVWTITAQFVLGILLYAMSPLVRTGLGDMGAAMRDPGLRKMVVEHPTMMLISIALVHVGAARIRKSSTDSGRYQTAAIWWGIALASVLGFIPWYRPLMPF